MRDLSIMRAGEPRQPASWRLPESETSTAWRAQDISAILGTARAERNRLALLVLCFVALGAAYALATPRMYSATSSILIDERRVVDGGDPASASRTLSDIGMDTASIDSQVTVIGSERVAVRVLKQLGLEKDASLAAPMNPIGRIGEALRRLRPTSEPETVVDGVPFSILEGFSKRLEIKRQQQTFVIDVGFRDFSPARAVQIADAVVSVYADERINESSESKAKSIDWLREKVAAADADVVKAGKQLDVSPSPAAQRNLEAARRVFEALVSRMNAALSRQTLPVSAVSVLSDAVAPPQPSQPKVAICLLLGAFAGFAAALGYATWRATSDSGFRVPSEVEDTTGVRTLGVLPRFPRLASWRRHPQAGRAVVALRAAVAATRAMAGDRPCIVGIVSATSGEGRSSVAKLLAEVLVTEGRKVLLLDADARGPLDLSAPSRLEPVAVVPGPDILSLPPTLGGFALTPNRLRQVLEDCARAHYDDVVIDLPPLTDLAGPAALASQVDAFLLAVSWRAARRGFVAEALRASPAVYERVVGAVLNRADIKAMARFARDHRDALHLAASPAVPEAMPQ